jgi:hypothetical protein
VDIEDRRHRRGACYPMLSGRSELASTDRQARYAPGSVEGIRGALDWAGLDYDHGDHTSLCANLNDVFCDNVFRSRKRWPTPPIFSGTVSRKRHRPTELTIASVRAFGPIPNLRQEAQ